MSSSQRKKSRRTTTRETTVVPPVSCVDLSEATIGARDEGPLIRKTQHNTDCKKYFECVINRWIARDCAEGTTFNQDEKGCDSSKSCKPSRIEELYEEGIAQLKRYLGIDESTETWIISIVKVQIKALLLIYMIKQSSTFSLCILLLRRNRLRLSFSFSKIFPTIPIDRFLLGACSQGFSTRKLYQLHKVALRRDLVHSDKKDFDYTHEENKSWCKVEYRFQLLVFQRNFCSLSSPNLMNLQSVGWMRGQLLQR